MGNNDGIALKVIGRERLAIHRSGNCPTEGLYESNARLPSL